MLFNSGFTGKLFYGAMPTTSQVNSEEYREFFESFLKQGKDILHLSFSSGLSGSYNSARLAREETHYKQGGRISPAAAFGNVLNICPLMNMNHQGGLYLD